MWGMVLVARMVWVAATQAANRSKSKRGEASDPTRARSKFSSNPVRWGRRSDNLVRLMDTRSRW